MASCSLRSTVKSIARYAAGLLLIGAVFTSLETQACAQATDAWVEGQGYSQGVNPVRGQYTYKNQSRWFRDRQVDSYHIRENRFLNIHKSQVNRVKAEGPAFNDTYYHRWTRGYHIYRGGHTWSPDDCGW
ncbi:MAG: hypothetical protein O2955_08135 [Planctomycetota bacterium]|nr:hypothetical protein [Planctomycetota bacterium]MDA1212471.1 hypothetical protein [Planctomycetota bacterium]